MDISKTSRIRTIRLNIKITNQDLIGKKTLRSGFGLQETDPGWPLNSFLPFYPFMKRYLKYTISEIVEHGPVWFNGGWMNFGTALIAIAHGKTGSSPMPGDSGGKIHIQFWPVIYMHS